MCSKEGNRPVGGFAKRETEGLAESRSKTPNLAGAARLAGSAPRDASGANGQTLNTGQGS
jgi:hypothetical protein